jgi:hypothetical protein
MNIKITITSICVSLLSLPILAAPVEYDTPDAHIIVMRALDSWSGDNSASEDSLEAVAKHEGGFRYNRPKGLVLGFPLLFGFNGDSNADAVVQGVVLALKPLDFKLTQLKTNFSVEKPVALDPTKYASFVNYQRELFKHLVISQGNPVARPRQVSFNKFFGAVLSLGTVAVAGEKFGGLGSQVVLGSGIAGDVYQLSASSKAALGPINLPDFDASSYKSIDVRRVIQGNNDRLGQVIIAYKNNKTDDAENTALIKAIVTLTGADTTVPDIKQARVDDLAKRQAIWDACVSDGKCKNE